MTAEKGSMLVGRLKVPKSFDVLADKLRERILAGELPPGTALATERELGLETGLSRSSIREAIRILVAEGLVETRPGRNGGARVRSPGNLEFNHFLDLYVRGRQISFESLVEVREALEPLAARLAAQNRSDETLRDLERLTLEVEGTANDLPAFWSANAEWHIAVAAAGGNDILLSFMHAISQAIKRGAAKVGSFSAEDMTQATLRAHRRIFEAIRDGDPEAAERRMARHVAAARKVAEEDFNRARDKQAGDKKTPIKS